ncbi:MAG: electron transfer flavoprotein subunit alpha/FixB family protein [candidate division WOR-3 bacterium]|nr:MAG: electron transfer flavoprotein subunit alpha/FixB family protein [candidate division WOR-3 bacterium]
MVLVVTEQREGVLKKAAYEALLVGFGLARQKSEQPVAAVLGSGVSGLAERVVRFGVKEVVTLDDAVLEHYTSEAYSAAVADLAIDRGFTTVLFAATALGKDLASAVAARLETRLLQDCVVVELQDGAMVARRPVFAGKAIASVRAPDTGRTVVSIRPRAFDPQTQTEKSAEIVSAELKPLELRSRVAEIVRSVSETVELTEADVVVSGGRGMKGSENFGMLEELAKAVGAAVGASRAAVDAGWRDHQDQVGQTGKVVAPTVYIACGISGAIQHLVGMINSKCIVAVNKDAEANILKVADYGIVGDVFKVVPLLTDEFRKTPRA